MISTDKHSKEWASHEPLNIFEYCEEKVGNQTNRGEENSNKSNEIFVLFVGCPDVGKSSLINDFLGKKETQIKPTSALSYQYARMKRKGANSSVKDTVNIWELGGKMCPESLVAAPLKHHLGNAIVIIVLDLSEPMNIIPSLKKWLNAVNKAFNVDKKTREGFKKETEKTSCSTGIQLMIIANKYDIFKNQDRLKRKTITIALRFLSHIHKASLVFTSIKDKIAQERVSTCTF